VKCKVDADQIAFFKDDNNFSKEFTTIQIWDNDYGDAGLHELFDCVTLLIALLSVWFFDIVYIETSRRFTLK
jgi:hypothetical protein